MLKSSIELILLSVCFSLTCGQESNGLKSLDVRKVFTWLSIYIWHIQWRQHTICPLKASCTVELRTTSLVSIHLTTRSLSFLTHCKFLSLFGQIIIHSLWKTNLIFPDGPTRPIFLLVNCPYTRCSPRQAEEKAKVIHCCEAEIRACEEGRLYLCTQKSSS